MARQYRGAAGSAGGAVAEAKGEGGAHSVEEAKMQMQQQLKKIREQEEAMKKMVATGGDPAAMAQLMAEMGITPEDMLAVENSNDREEAMRELAGRMMQQSGEGGRREEAQAVDAADEKVAALAAELEERRKEVARVQVCSESR